MICILSYLIIGELFGINIYTWIFQADIDRGRFVSKYCRTRF